MMDGAIFAAAYGSLRFIPELGAGMPADCFRPKCDASGSFRPCSQLDHATVVRRNCCFLHLLWMLSVSAMWSEGHCLYLETEMSALRSAPME
jgi:hypothetical protein